VGLLGGKVIVRALDDVQLFPEDFAAPFELVFLDGERLDVLVLGPRALLKCLRVPLQQFLLIAQRS